MSDDAIRRALRRLAEGNGTERRDDERRTPSPERSSYRTTIARATDALGDVEAAAQFVEDVGLDELERAVECAERSVSTCAADGRRALRAYRTYEAVAAGDQFHPAHGTSLGGGAIGPSK